MGMWPYGTAMGKAEEMNMQSHASVVVVVVCFIYMSKARAYETNGAGQGSECSVQSTSNNTTVHIWRR